MLGSSPCDTEVGGDAPPCADAPSRRGETLGGKYELMQRIGHGSMGDVYEARHLQLERRFAVKLLRGEHLASERMVLRFMLEMRAASCLESIHIVPAIDCGHARDGAPYYVMDLLRGEDLGRILARERSLDVGRAVALAIDVCRGLEVAHRRGLVHRDLKPQNVFVARGERGGELAKVLDFGLVRLDGSTTATTSPSLLGTVRYMAPEQARHPALVDARADIYALGAVLYECLGAEPPHAAGTAEKILARRLKHAPKPLCELRAGLPRGLDAVVRRALAGDPRRRYQSAAEFGRALERYAARAFDDRCGERRPRATTSIAPVSIQSADDTTDDALAGRATSASWPTPRALQAFAGAGILVTALVALAFARHERSLPSARTEVAATPPGVPALPPASSLPPAAAPPRVGRREELGVETTRAGHEPAVLQPRRANERTNPVHKLASPDPPFSASAVTVSPSTSSSTSPRTVPAVATSLPAAPRPRLEPKRAWGRPLDEDNPYRASSARP